MNGQRLASVPGYSNQLPSLSGDNGSKATTGQGIQELPLLPLYSVFFVLP